MLRDGAKNREEFLSSFIRTGISFDSRLLLVVSVEIVSQNCLATQNKNLSTPPVWTAVLRKR